jgi:hypothetical protein
MPACHDRNDGSMWLLWWVMLLGAVRLAMIWMRVRMEREH